MSPLVARLRVAYRAHLRAFHSPFVALGPSSRFTPPAPSNPAPVYEKQHDSSPEPHTSSSGTRTYVVSEPDPSHTPYQVPSGAYPASAPYVNPGSSSNSDALQGSASSLRHSYTTRTVGENAGAKNTDVPGDMGRREGSNSGRM